MPLPSFKGFPTTTNEPIIDYLYAYDTITKERIWNLKIKSQLRDIGDCVEEFCEWLSTEPFVRQFEHVMPMPSSLWGRWRGRIDIADFLAEGVRVNLGMKLRLPPFRLGWHFKKQAQKRGQLVSLGTIMKLEAPLLVVDDIVTTGQSFERLRQSIEAPMIALRCFAGPKH